MRRTLSVSLRLLAAAGFVLVGRAADAENPPSVVWTVDGVHSTVLFKVRRDGVTNFFGRFDDIGGTFELPAPGSPGRVHFEIKTGSLSTGAGGRDQRLRGDEFLATDKHALATFDAPSVERLAPDLFAASGQLTIRGISKPLRIQVRKLGEKTSDKGEKHAGFETVFKFRRGEFGVKGMAGYISDEVEVTVSLACKLPPPTKV